MAKPTTPFGTQDFTSDGKVKSNIQKLSDKKVEQERAVASRLLQQGAELFKGKATIEPLKENDNDFKILLDGTPRILVECIELVSRDFVADKGAETDEMIKLPDGTQAYVDLERRANALVAKIEHKFAKHYAKPKDLEFWLLIWNVTGCPEFGHVRRGNGVVVQEPVVRARNLLAKKGPTPFDMIISFNMLTKPTIVWP
jgi:hypothetical protein